MIKLIPIAKPVRFTIKSGGRDCADLEGLRKSFNVDDLNKIEIKQLQEWAKRKCTDAPSIAERLNKKPSELEYYQIFFQQDFKDLHAAWQWLKETDEYSYSAEVLSEKLYEERFKHKSIDQIESLLNDTKLKDIADHKEFFTNFASELVSNEPLINTAEFRVLKILADYGIANADNYVKSYANADNYVESNSTFTKELDPMVLKMEYTNLLLYILTCKGNIEKRLKKKYGGKLDSLPDNLTSFYKAVCYCMPDNGEDSPNYFKAIKQLEKKEPLSKERRFLRALCFVGIGLENKEIHELKSLSSDGYVFANLFIGRPLGSKMPRELINYVNNNYFEISYNKRISDFLPGFLRIYFRYFLDEEYYHGELEDL